MEHDFDELLGLVSAALGVTPEHIRMQIEQRRAKLQRRAARNNARYFEALERITKEQMQTIQALRALGAKTWSKLRQDKVSGNVCIFLSREVWNGAKGRMGTKIYAVYPDGSRSETFERSISVRSQF